MSDFRTVLIEDSRIADITSTEVFGVQSSAAQSTYQQFQAVSTSNSSITFNVQVPSENIVIDRHLLLAAEVALEITATGVPIGQQAFQYGLTDCLQAFPLNSLFTTTQATINNVSVSTNLQDVLPMLMRMNDKRMLSRYNSMTPSLPDSAYGEYKNAPGSNNNPLAAYNNASYDEDFEPRGAYHLKSLQIDRYAGGVYQDHSPISTDPTNVFKIFLKVELTEPFLALSPFVNCEPQHQAGLVGVNNMSMVLNVDNSCRRVFSTANNSVVGNGLSGYITNIALGWADAPNGGSAQAVGFQNTRLLFNFLSLQPEQYAKISTKNVVPYLDYPRYLTTFASGTTIAPLASQTLTSQSIQLNQIPDLILITARVPMSQQNWNYASSFLTINNISVNFNNASGLLASATQQDLYNISFRNGSAQSYYEFRGFADNNNNATGNVTAIPTTGSLLVLNPVFDFSLPSYLSASSLGQYQFQFNLNVTNQFDFSVSQPEICIITMNSGIFATQQGTSQIFTGILTKEQVLRTKEQNPVPHLASDEYKRLVGGKLQNRGMGSVMKMVREMPRLSSVLKGAMMPSMPGAVSSGAGMSGGAISGGKKSSSKLAKHLC
ncbi:MAG: hypothetical protein EBU90_19390 [Proteobacteria bacterium]|nr:hypothetical protein [Pseudomonadota bacterium]